MRNGAWLGGQSVGMSSQAEAEQRRDMAAAAGTIMDGVDMVQVVRRARRVRGLNYWC
jgi:hypothetical protein